jgi:hypothetical protein
MQMGNSDERGRECRLARIWLCKAPTTTENTPAGSRGEFWGYYREERPARRRSGSGIRPAEPNLVQLIPL